MHKKNYTPFLINRCFLILTESNVYKVNSRNAIVTKDFDLRVKIRLFAPIPAAEFYLKNFKNDVY